MQYKITHMPVTLMYPKGTYRKKIFYSRGDDIYLEPEWTEKIKIDLQARYKVALKEYSDMKQEYKEVENQFNEIDKCTVQIAEKLSDEDNMTTENVELRQQIKELSQNADEIRQEIESIRNKTTPTSISYLLKELASYMPEYETNDVNRNISLENIENFERAICELTATDKYQRSILSDAEYRISIQCRNDMKNHLQSIHKSMDGAPSIQNSQLRSSANAISQQKNDILSLLDDLIELKLSNDEKILQKELASSHRRFMIKTLVGEIEELNDFLNILNEETIDIEKVKENIGFEQIEAEEREIAERKEKCKQERNDRPLTQIKTRPSTMKQTNRSYPK